MLPALDPRQSFARWRESVGATLAKHKGSVASLARHLAVTDNQVGDWFTLRRSDPPGWVVHWAVVGDGVSYIGCLIGEGD